MTETKSFDWVARARSFRFAANGVRMLLVSEHNARIHAAATLLVIAFGLATGISRFEWCWMVVAMAGVWTAEAFNTVIPYGGLVVAAASLMFGISTLFGWCYYGEMCGRYLFGVKITTPYRVAFISIMFLGSLPDGENFDITAVVAIGDLGNGMMAIPNLIALLILTKVVAKETWAYRRDRQDAG